MCTQLSHGKRKLDQVKTSKSVPNELLGFGGPRLAPQLAKAQTSVWGPREIQVAREWPKWVGQSVCHSQACDQGRQRPKFRLKGDPTIASNINWETTITHLDHIVRELKRRDLNTCEPWLGWTEGPWCYHKAGRIWLMHRENSTHWYPREYVCA